MERMSDNAGKGVYNSKFEEYTVNVSFVMSVSARSRTEARVNVLNKLQFPGDAIANLIVTVKDLPDDE